MKKEKIVKVYQEHAVQVTDIDSGGDVYHPLYYMINEDHFKDGPKHLQADTLETYLKRKAKYDPNNIIAMTGNSMEFDYLGPTGKTLKVTTIKEYLSEREEGFNEDELSQIFY